MRSVGFFLVTTVLVAVQLGHVLGQLANTGVVEDEGCICVAYYNCVNDTIRTTVGRDVMDPRANFPMRPRRQRNPLPSSQPSTIPEMRLGECNGTLEVCCKRPNVRSSRLRAVTTPAAPCGRGNPDGVGFTLTVAKDGETNFGEFPWVVAVLRRELHVDGSIRTAYECGGSLIHPQVVLTAAQCVVKLKLNDLIIRAGEWDVITLDEPYLHQERSVRKVIIHEDYDDYTMFNDIALLILEEPVTTARDAHINVVCLPTQGETFDHTRCFAAGWGKNVHGKDEPYATILKKKELPIVPHSTCENALRTALLGPYYELDDSFVCAGGEEGIDTCEGDGGSPLVCPLVDKPDQFKQVGIVSWGLDCGQYKVPGIYANVAIQRNWIDQKMIANNFNTAWYTYTK